MTTDHVFYRAPDEDDKDLVFLVQGFQAALRRTATRGGVPLAELVDRLDAQRIFPDAWPRNAKERLTLAMLSMGVCHRPLGVIVSPRGEIRAPDDTVGELWAWFQALGGRYEDGELFGDVAHPLLRLLSDEPLSDRLGSSERTDAFLRRARAEETTQMREILAMASYAAQKFENPTIVAKVVNRVQQARERGGGEEETP